MRDVGRSRVLNHVMGSGMSSRLFREVRRSEGSPIYGFKMAYADAGAWGVYVGTTPSPDRNRDEL